MAKLTGVKAVLADKSRLAKWKANPGLRNKLPEKYLTPEQRLARRMGREIFPGAGVTGFDQARQAKTATEQVYGPQRRALLEPRQEARCDSLLHEHPRAVGADLALGVEVAHHGGGHGLFQIGVVKNHQGRFAAKL